MSKPFKMRAKIFNDGRVERVEDDDPDLTEDNDLSEIARSVAATVKAYVDAAEALLNGKYSQIRDYVPIHLSMPGPVLVVLASDGLVIRFGRKSDPSGVTCGTAPLTLVDLVPVISQNLVHCYKDRDFTSAVPTTGLTLVLQKTSPSANTTETISTMRVGFDIVIEKPSQFPTPPSKPFCLLSVQNSVDIQLHGVLMPEADRAGSDRQFIARSKLRLPVEWECIEVYPFIQPEHWKPEYAPMWAENDILGAVVANQFNAMHFDALDPKAAARRELAQILKSYGELLDSNPEREESLQVFLRNHPVLLCPAHVKMWPKQPLGARETDFVFREAAGDYLLVELEESTHRLFLKDGHTSKELNHARGQITDWKRYLEDNLHTVQNELGLSEISANPKSLIVIGRSESLTADNKRKLVTLENESPRVEIMTYDEVYDNAKAIIENLLGLILEAGGNTEI